MPEMDENLGEMRLELQHHEVPLEWYLRDMPCGLFLNMVLKSKQKLFKWK